MFVYCALFDRKLDEMKIIDNSETNKVIFFIIGCSCITRVSHYFRPLTTIFSLMGSISPTFY